LLSKTADSYSQVQNAVWIAANSGNEFLIGFVTTSTHIWIAYGIRDSAHSVILLGSVDEVEGFFTRWNKHCFVWRAGSGLFV